MTKVFISWSGEQSKSIGEAVKVWLSGVLQQIKPYFTPTDIEKGARWSQEIKRELSESKLGIFIITPENLNSNWLHFEAGAISNSIDQSSVCPLLFNVDPADLSGPLAQFQATKFNKSEAKKLIENLNEKLGDNKLASDVLNGSFDVWWPNLNDKLQNIYKSGSISSKNSRSDRDILEEILQNTRNISTLKPNTLNNKSTGHAVAHVLNLLKDHIFAKFSTETTTKRQIEMLKRLETDLLFEIELDRESALDIMQMVEEGIESLNAHYSSQVNSRKNKSDDIPF